MALFADDDAAALRSVDWAPTRAAGLARLKAFLPHAGHTYARERNIDRGPSDRANVSGLSPWIRRRLITEDEVLGAVMRAHGASKAEKFIQEVFWRTYWKGYLELRPQTLHRFNDERLALQARLARDHDLAARMHAAINAETGIACFDAWVSELIDLGWLHNHARMWFASIWIFTLKLPWQLGADFMFKHLLDADPASNTLSWRWVAGLHTPGKHYLARAANIHTNTGGRFDPVGALDENAAPLSEDAPVLGPGEFEAPLAIGANRVGLLLHDDDLHPESLDIPATVVGAAGLKLSPVGPADGPKARFADGALEDGLARASTHFGVAADVLDAGGVGAWAKAQGVREVVCGHAPVGLTGWALSALREELAKEGVRLTHVLRAYDARAWPHAKAGFFKFRARIPHLLSALGSS